jgi:hypothetical protein
MQIKLLVVSFKILHYITQPFKAKFVRFAHHSSNPWDDHDKYCPIKITMKISCLHGPENWPCVVIAGPQVLSNYLSTGNIKSCTACKYKWSHKLWWNFERQEQCENLCGLRKLATCVMCWQEQTQGGYSIIFATTILSKYQVTHTHAHCLFTTA